MSLFSNFAKNFLNSLAITGIFLLIGLSLFIGDFPPSVSQVKNVFAEYKKLLQFKQQLVSAQYAKPEDLTTALEKGKKDQLKALGQSRSAYQDYANQVEQIGQEGAAIPAQANTIRDPATNEVLVAEAKTSASIPQEWQEQFYHLKSEVLRLNQRVQELERKQVSIPQRK